jgi:hypothetical protein
MRKWNWNPFQTLSDQIDRLRWDVLTGLSILSQKVLIMASSLDDLTGQVAKTVGVEESAITLIQGFAAQLAAAGTDPVKLDALKTQLATSQSALAAAVAANSTPTPPAPAP